MCSSCFGGRCSRLFPGVLDGSAARTCQRRFGGPPSHSRVSMRQATKRCAAAAPFETGRGCLAGQMHECDLPPASHPRHGCESRTTRKAAIISRSRSRTPSQRVILPLCHLPATSAKLRPRGRISAVTLEILLLTGAEPAREGDGSVEMPTLGLIRRACRRPEIYVIVKTILEGYACSRRRTLHPLTARERDERSRRTGNEADCGKAH